VLDLRTSAAGDRCGDDEDRRLHRDGDEGDDGDPPLLGQEPDEPDHDNADTDDDLRVADMRPHLGDVVPQRSSAVLQVLVDDALALQAAERPLDDLAHADDEQPEDDRRQEDAQSEVAQSLADAGL